MASRTFGCDISVCAATAAATSPAAAAAAGRRERRARCFIPCCRKIVMPTLLPVQLSCVIVPKVLAAAVFSCLLQPVHPDNRPAFSFSSSFLSALSVCSCSCSCYRSRSHTCACSSYCSCSLCVLLILCRRRLFIFGGECCAGLCAASGRAQLPYSLRAGGGGGEMRPRGGTPGKDIGHVATCSTLR